MSRISNLLLISISHFKWKITSTELAELVEQVQQAKLFLLLMPVKTNVLYRNSLMFSVKVTKSSVRSFKNLLEMTEETTAMALGDQADMVVTISTLVITMAVIQTIVTVLIQMENATATTPEITETITIVKMKTTKLKKVMDPELVDIIRISETEKIAIKDKEKAVSMKIDPSVQRKNERNMKKQSITGISLPAF